MAWTPPHTFVALEVPSAAQWNLWVSDNLAFLYNGVWSDFTPTWRLGANVITVGNGTTTGRYRQNGKNLDFYAKFLIGSTTAFPVNATFTLDLPVSAQDGAQVARPIGAARGLDSSPVTDAWGPAEIGVAANRVAFINVATSSPWSGTVPWTWANGDSLLVTGSYEAA